MAEHEHRFGAWRFEDSNRIWRRDCLVGGCDWHQMQTTNPHEPTDFDRALGRLAGIEPDDGMGELLEAVSDVVSDFKDYAFAHTSTLERLRDAFYVVCPPETSTSNEAPAPKETSYGVAFDLLIHTERTALTLIRRNADIKDHNERGALAIQARSAVKALEALVGLLELWGLEDLL